ncbi:alpha-N-acetylneuraminide alpha-2,8-sialyltransferase-like isoform X1 [Saccoglossus kowalevskii]
MTTTGHAHTRYIIPPKQTCALVGNGGIILDSTCGADIDSNDFVIRCNEPEISGFERDVGNKTDLIIVNKQVLRHFYSWYSNNKVSILASARETSCLLNESIICHPTGFVRKQVNASIADPLIQFSKNGLDIPFLMANAALQGSSGNFKKFLPLHGHPSMGMKAIVAAMSFCKHLTVYGFYPYRFAPDGHEVFYHYYGREANKTCEDGVRGKHHLNEEFELIRTLHENNVIRLVLEKCQ